MEKERMKREKDEERGKGKAFLLSPSKVRLDWIEWRDRKKEKEKEEEEERIKDLV
ncbi:conserved hypothetical protein [Ricinus communis]|uniref:Uncharacterized protein n=1 Tax=Ricinus communis TaxID=3988 RepID=B9R7S3_RICCO|nr:conserved hypothetical protein [Ricinus communis]